MENKCTLQVTWWWGEGWGGCWKEKGAQQCGNVVKILAKDQSNE